MAKKWIVPLLLALPFVPVLFWGFYLPEAAYASLGAMRQAVTWPEILAEFGAGYETLSTPLFSTGVHLLSSLGLEPANAAALLGTLGWGMAAALMWWFGRKMKYGQGSLAAAALFCLNPWIVMTLGQATGWIIALTWLIANFLIRKRLLVAILGALFLLSLFFRPSQGLAWPGGLAQPLTWSILLFSAGAGLEWLAAYLVKSDRIALDQQQAATIFLVLFSAAVLFWEGSRLWEAWETRPLALWSVEEEAASWLREHSNEDAALLAGERLAYLAGRKSVAASPDELQELLAADAPDYVIADQTLPWQLLREAIWFRLYYEPLASFGGDETGESRKEIFAYREPQEWLGTVELINARVPDRLSVLGYQMEPRPVVSGQPVNMALHLQAPRATLIEPAPFDVILRLVSPQNSESAGEWTVSLPRTVAAGEWQAEQVIVEPIQIRPPQDLESGAYVLNLSFTGEGEQEFWPISLDNDVNRLDRMPLGYVVIPWNGSLGSITPLTADFAGGIHLAGYESGEAAAGEALDVTLYWQTTEAVDEEYIVFVHLLDGDGRLVANHDGPPANGRFPSEAWLPEMTVPDAHAIALPPELTPGDYEMRAGLYDPSTGQRLPVSFIEGEPVEGDSVSLGSVTVN